MTETTILGFTDALNFEIARALTVTASLLGLVAAYKVLAAFLREGLRAVLVVIFTAGIAFWAVTGGGFKFFQNQAENEADAIVKRTPSVVQSTTEERNPVVTLPSDVED